MNTYSSNNNIDNPVRKYPDQALSQAARLFRVLADGNRLRILYALDEREMSVNALASELKIEQSALSHQLKILRDTRLVKSRKDGRSRLYSQDDEHVRILLKDALEHVTEAVEDTEMEDD